MPGRSVEADHCAPVRWLDARAAGEVSRAPREGRRLTSKVSIFTHALVLVCLATLLYWPAQSLVLTAVPPVPTHMGLVTEFVGLFVGAFSLGALIVRLPVGAVVDRLGWPAVGLGRAGRLGVGCLLCAVVPLAPVQMPLTAGVPLLLPLAGMAHSVGFSTYGTSASSFVACTVPATRRGEDGARYHPDM